MNIGIDDREARLQILLVYDFLDCNQSLWLG